MKKLILLLLFVIASNTIIAQSTLTTKENLRGKRFNEGNYAMFIHWGLYSNLAGKWKGETYYGISEWLMNKRMANIPIDEYMKTANNFNPINFDPKYIANLAKDAGMKYIIITSKHHDGFAMFKSKVSKFNIVDATPFARDPMKELADACKEANIGFGFYYSHNQDWTTPGGKGAPEINSKGDKATFKDYFEQKCLPQVKELTTNYGEIEIIWFDTPGGMDKKYVEELVSVVRKNQPNALVSGRAGHGLGDYKSIGDMEVPASNQEGMWETVDVTNDSWGYAWYDKNWKSPKKILSILISTVARGGTLMLNVGPKPDGSIPKNAAKSLLNAGKWIKYHPYVVYGAEASPWKHKMPWGDVTKKEDKLFLSIYNWPIDGKLYVPGLTNGILTCKIQTKKGMIDLSYKYNNGWTVVELPDKRPNNLISVVTVQLTKSTNIESLHGVDPTMETILLADFSNVINCKKRKKSWMEKFGEWKYVIQIQDMQKTSKAIWEVDVYKSGDYLIKLNYSGRGKLVWSVDSDEGVHIQNQKNSSSIYADHTIGWITFKKSGKHTLSVSLLEGDREKASLKSINISPIEYEE